MKPVRGIVEWLGGGVRGDWLTVLGVLLVHVLVLVLVRISSTQIVVPKRSEITIEIGASPPPGSAEPGGVMQASAEVVLPVPDPSPTSEQSAAEPALATALAPDRRTMPLAQPEPRSEPQSEPQSEPKPQLKPEPQPEPKPESRLDQEPTPDPILVPNPEPKPEPKPQPLPEPKPKPKPEPRPSTEQVKPAPAPVAPPILPPIRQAAPSTTPMAPKPSAPSAANTAGGGAGGGGGGAVVDADYKAAYLRNPKPIYPSAALKMRVEGTVTLRVLVLEDGTSGKIVLSKSSGNESLDQSALETVAKWKFTPAKSQGQSVTQWVSIPINFSIKRR